VALTLREVCGLTTDTKEIAKAFLTTPRAPCKSGFGS
jgi:predicted RNA polymerase sigma factor